MTKNRAFIMDKLTEHVERLAHELVAVPVIVETKEKKFRTVADTLRNYVLSGVFERGLSFPLYREIPTFNYVAALLPREWVFDLGEAREVKKVYPNTFKKILQFPTVPQEGIFEWKRGIFGEKKQFTTTYFTKKLIGADIANQKGFDGTGVRVAVTDTGLSMRLPMTRRMVLDSAMTQVHDEVGHGEWCAACVGGVHATDDRLGRLIHRKIPCEGMAPGAFVVGIKCLGYGIGTGTDDSIIKAIEMAYTKYSADVISMSLGGDINSKTQEDDPYYKIITDLTQEGVIFCIAAGNSGPKPMTIGTPGWIEDALTVGALDPIKGCVASYSSRGPTPDNRIKPDCVSYGGGIDNPIHNQICGWLDRAGDNINNNFSPICGTSMATPHVAGLVTCMRQAHQKLLGKILTTFEIKDMLEEFANNVKSNDTGWGLLTWQMYENWLETQYGVKI